MNIIGISTKCYNFKIIDGTIPILLSAPHAVKQERDGKVKLEEVLTGSIVEYLCMQTGVHGIVRVANYNDDPNYYNKGESLKYKQAILDCIKEKNIKIFLDIHGCTDDHGFDIEFGTNYGKNINYDKVYLEVFEKEFSKIGKVVIDKKFKADKSTIVSSFVNENTEIQCIQIEISRKFRREGKKLEELLSVFEEVINNIINIKI